MSTVTPDDIYDEDLHGGPLGRGAGMGRIVESKDAEENGTHCDVRHHRVCREGALVEDAAATGPVAMPTRCSPRDWGRTAERLSRRDGSTAKVPPLPHLTAAVTV